MLAIRRRLLVLPLLIAAACGDGSPGPVDAPGPPASISVLDGFPARGSTGEPLPVLPGVRVRDGAGRGVPGVTVTFRVESGGGSVAAASAVTDANGVARSGAWTLGTELGEQVLGVRAGTVSAVFRIRAEWKLTAVAASLPERNLQGFRVHPQDDRVWFAMSSAGLHVSHDAGATWTLPLPGLGMNDRALAFDPASPDTVFMGTWDRVLVSGDRGRTWSERAKLPGELFIRSMLVSARDGALLVGPQWPAGRTPGVLRSEDRGLTWTHHPYGVAPGLQVLTWDLHEDRETGMVWAGNEIADHPQPYRPPFLMSPDGGRTWQDVTTRLPFLGNPWHVIQVERAGGVLLALSEGAGLFRSTDGGASWQYAGRDFGLQLAVDPHHPRRVFGGNFGTGFGDGGVYVSYTGGLTFQRAATAAGPTSSFSVSGFAVSADGTRLYVASYGGGIMMAQLPPP